MKRKQPDQNNSSYVDFLINEPLLAQRGLDFDLGWSDLIGTEVGTNKKYIQALPMTLFKSINLRFKYTSTGLGLWDLQDQSGVGFNVLQVNNMNALSLTNNTKAAAWDSWVQFYDRYITKWVNIEITYVNNSDYPVYVGITYRPIAEVGGATWSNLRYSTTNGFPNKQVLLTPKGGKKDTATLNVACDLSKLWGLSSQHNDFVSFSSSTVGEPTIKQQAIIYSLFNQNNSAPGTCLINYNVKMTFLTTMYQNKILLGV